MEENDEILRKLYNGEINPNKDIPNTDEYKKLVKAANKLILQIEEKINDKKIVDEYIEIQSQIASIDCESKFIEGYKLALQLLIKGIIN